jgi:hypothetical protein
LVFIDSFHTQIYLILEDFLTIPGNLNMFKSYTFSSEKGKQFTNDKGIKERVCQVAGNEYGLCFFLYTFPGF